MTMCGYVWLCIAIYAMYQAMYAMYGYVCYLCYVCYVWLCMTMYDYV